MNSLPRLAIFLSVVATITGLLHGYAWLRLVHDPGWPAGVTVALTLLAVALAILLPSTMLGTRLLPPRVAVPLAWAGFVWLGTIFYLDVTLLALDLGRGLFEGVAYARFGAPTMEGVGAARALSLVASAITLGLVTMGVARGRSAPTVRRVRVPVEGLPAVLEGFRIAQLTDVHVGPMIRRDFVTRIVAQVNALAPDLVAITGDLVDGSVKDLASEVAPLAELKAPSGRFFVTGNHEYFADPDGWCAHVGSLGIEVLRNRHVVIEKNGGRFVLAGIDDAHAPRFGGESDLGRALHGRDPSLPVVLLAHQPRSVREASAAGVALQISGHTHGGQMQPFGALVRVEQPVLKGLHKSGPTALYVSEGTGTWGPPLRVGTTSEIALLELVRA